MGSVWRAWDERLRRPVAIKQIRPDRLDQPGARGRLRHEAAAGARLNHPAIVHIYDILQAGDVEWIVMELVEGRTLAEILAGGPLALSQAVRLGREIAKGLAKAHSEGIVHRDLKTLNVMVTPSGHAKILDFGIAKLFSSESFSDTGTFPGILVGTPYAMSPEQAFGLPVDPRSDLFSLGSLLYEMLTGVSPFQADTTAAILRRVRDHRQPPVRQLAPDVPPELSELVDWLLEKEPQHRPQDALEVAAVLNALLARQALEESGDGLATSQDRPSAPREDEMPTVAALWAAPAPALAESERRQVTVVCCGPTVPNPLAGEVAGRFGGIAGTAAGTADDATVWLCFGVPQAQGYDAQRAVRAALELVARAGGPLRAGIHSGRTEIPRDRPPAPALILHVAASLQEAAPAGEVVVSEATRRLISRGFETEPLPPARLRSSGMEESVPAFRVVAPLDSSEHAFAAAAVPLVGREGELGVLRQRWQLVQEGESQVALVSGEPGIGKSRLVRALRESLGDQAPRWLFWYGAAHAHSSPFHPIVKSLRRSVLGSARSPEEELARLEDALCRYGLSVEDDLPILASLLSLPPPAGAPRPLSAEARRQRTFEALLNLLLQVMGEYPQVLVIEDLHWLDPSSLELAGALLDALGGASVLVILTFRLDFELPWRHRSGWTQLRLSRLTDADALEIVDRLAGDDNRLPAAVRQQIVAKSDGVPLFVEELTRGMVEAEAPAGIPGLLRDSLTARLDRLGGAREVAQLAAVIGRSFSFELLAAVSPLDCGALLKALDQLVRAELLVRRGSGERGSYHFRHALLQEAACELLIPADLERLHLAVAEALETRFPETAAAQIELVADHYTQARRPEKAIALWLQAGRTALQRFANQEASERFRKGLRLINALPEGPARDRTELALQIGAARAVIVSRGHSDDEVEVLFDRALALGNRLGETPHELQSLLWSFYTWRADFPKARTAALQTLRAARARRDLEGAILGLQEIATLQVHFGRPRSALRFLRRALALYPEGEDGTPQPFPGWDARRQNVCEAARALCVAGNPDLALRYGRRGLHLAEAREDPYGTVLAFQSLAFVHHARREYEEASLHAQWMVDLCLKQGFAFFAVHGRFLLSLSNARLARPEEAVPLVGEAIQALDALRRDHRQELSLPEFLGWIVEACLVSGMTSEARWLLEDACEIAFRTGERLGRSELFRFYGLLLLAEAADGTTAEPWAQAQAEASFLAALAEAHTSGSRWLELRAATDLARLWSRHRHAPEARELLSKILCGITEGVGTADMELARDLRAELEAAQA
jgi:tetratricopeptide (TPR) repeat protein